MKQRARHMNFELNLVPMIDILSVSISFLLITTVFLQLGTLNVKQGMGDAGAETAKNPPSAFIKVENDGHITFTLKDLPQGSQAVREFSIQGIGGRVDSDRALQYIEFLKNKYPEVQTASLLPGAQAKYQDLIMLIDVLRKNSIINVGISPL